MKYRNFGNTGLQVSEMGFGCARLGGILAQGKGSGEIIGVLCKAFDEGINFFDTADMYSQGESESLLGQAFRNKRDKVIIASKGGYCLPAQRKLMAKIKPLVRPLVRILGIKRENLPSGITGTLAQDFSPSYLVQAVEGSLRRLKTDYLDIYQLHSPPAPVIQSGEFLETLESLKRQGKIRHYGIAADTADDACLCLQYSEISSLQMPFGILDMEALDAALCQADAKRIGIITRGCFGGGLLKETLTEQELKETTPKWPLILAFRRIAEQHGRSILEMALQFSLRVPATSVTLLGMRTETHLATNLRHYAGSPLTDSEYQEIIASRSETSPQE